MKKLNIKSFWIILSGIIATFIYKAVDLILSRSREFPTLKERLNEEQLQRLTTALFRMNFVFTLIFALICAYFIYRLIKNKTKVQGQKYITFLFVVNIIVAVFNVLSLLLGNFIALISIAINVAIIAGCSIQRNYEYKENIEV